METSDKERIEKDSRIINNIPLDKVIDEEERYYRDFQKYDSYIQGAEYERTLANKQLEEKDKEIEELVKHNNLLTLNGGLLNELKEKDLQLEEKDKEIEILRMQLAACGIAAMSNTHESRNNLITKENPYWSAYYGDVLDAVGREINYREQLARLKEALRKAFHGSKGTMLSKQTVEEIEQLLK
jgi:hypothetical protein